MDDGEVRSLNHRLRNMAAAESVDVNRLRNRLLFQRILERFAVDEQWVLKGGFALETRLWLHSRATKDLDVARTGLGAADADDLHDLLVDALAREVGDGFRLIPRTPRPVRAEDELPTTWRVVVDGVVASRPFGSATLDVVTSADLTDSDVERLRVDPVLVGKPFTIRAVDVDRHAAEKLHAYSRIYAHDRPSSRVKDLVDLALLLDRGLLSTNSLGTRLVSVFLERDGGPPPLDLEPPPGSWAEPFTVMARDLRLTTTDSMDAFSFVREAYLHCLGTIQKDTP